MTASHFILAASFTAYILIGVRIEERDLLAEHGVAYLEYRRRVPALLPSLRTRRTTAAWSR